MKAVPWNRILVFGSIATIGCLADLLSKHWMFAKVGLPFGPHAGFVSWLWEGPFSFGFQTSLNEGALWGFGQGGVHLFAILSVIAAIGVVGWFFYGKAYQSLHLTITLAMILAGILGNLYDRLGLPGLRWPDDPSFGNRAGTAVYAVRDWVLMVFGDHPWPNYNIADALLVCGAALLVWHAFFLDRPAVDQKTAGS
jgi:signal peptidase II